MIRFRVLERILILLKERTSMRMESGIEQVRFNFVLSFLPYPRGKKKRISELDPRERNFHFLLAILDVCIKFSHELCPMKGSHISVFISRI